MYVMVIIFMIPFLLKSQNQILTQVNNPNGERFHLLGDCHYEAEFTVTIANLDVLNNTICTSGQILPLPEGYPLMQLRMQISNVEEIVPVTSFEQVSCGYISLYEFTYTMRVDLSAECGGGDPNQNFNIHVSSSLMTPTKTMQSTYYPVCLYSTLNDLFPCVIFNETADYCYSDPPPCPGVGVSADTEVSCGEACVEHLSYRYGGSGGNVKEIPEVVNEVEIKIEDLESAINTTVKIHPNPFSDYLNLNFENADEILRIQLFDIGGRLIKSWENKDIKHTTTLNMNTLEFEKGIYFLNVQMKDSSESFKLIKS